MLDKLYGKDTKVKLLTLSPPVILEQNSNIRDVLSNCKGVQKLVILEHRIFTNVWKRLYTVIEGISFPLLRNNHF